MEYLLPICKLCHVQTRRWLLMVGIVAFTYILFQSLLLPYGDALRSLLPEDEAQKHDPKYIQKGNSSAKLTVVHNPLSILDLNSASTVPGKGEDTDSDSYILAKRFQQNSMPSKGQSIKKEEKSGHGYELSVYGNSGIGSASESSIEINDGLESDSITNGVHDPSLYVDDDLRFNVDLERRVKPNDDTTSGNNNSEEFRNLSSKKSEGADMTFSSSSSLVQGQAALSVNVTHTEYLMPNTSSSVGSLTLLNDQTVLKGDSERTTKRKRMKSEMPPKSITSIEEMNSILVRHRRSSRSMRPRRSSLRDQEIFSVKFQIENAPAINGDAELYAPLFRNISMFKRSYELMERTLKIFVYKDGSKPIFHQPILKGLYASEGWFMKLMEGNKHFVVKDPRKAHLFYMPFSSRMLEYTLYVRNSHNRTNLRQFLKEYSEKLAAKYPYWNRTGGADHFLVGCHDWAPYETRHHMEHCIKALCNADVTVGFKIGRDVSLPETYVRSARNPLRDLGGKPASQRHILAFYAGNMHGYVRPILLKYWKDKHPDMKIFGPMPPGVASKMNYIQHMKSSKYCICPKGYEVNSPRVVEAIFYECVPVIISDNFMPPFFEVLDWGAFSVVIAEKDIPQLRDILVSIPNERYLEMQLRVRKVQKHFLWHAKPLKYDLFHMTLHSIWYNRVFQIKLR